MNPYLSSAVLACFDGESNQGGQPNGEQTPPADGGERKFSQEELNQVLAKDRRKHEAQLQKMADTLESLSASKNLSEEEKANLASQLEEARASVRTKEQQLTHERQ
jgi:DNA-binding transcriptional MerR regulator